MAGIKIDPDFSGVLLENKGTQTIIKTFGYRDKANKLVNEEQTRFGTASLGKIFIAVAIMQLIEKESIHFDTTIDTFYPTSLGNIDLTITIQELLTHTSGLQDYFDEEVNEDYEALWKELPNYSIRKNKDIFPLFIHKEKETTRRGSFIYNNAGYVVLADIIEQLAAMPFDQYLAENIFQPLGMHDTGYFEMDQLPGNTAFGYIKEENNRYRTNIYAIDSKGTGAGGCYTTAGDIHTFWAGLFSYQLLSEKYVAEMIKPHIEQNKQKFGIGLWLTQSHTDHVFAYIEGSDPGVSCISLYGLTVPNSLTLLSNCEDNVWQIARDYLKTQ